MNKILNFKKIFLMTLIGFCIAGSKVLASDNILQAIQVNGVKDSYNIVLKSDDVAEVRKTIQAPNKMMLTLKGIRASKSINTIYNNTSSVDSVVVEPTGDDSVKILIQAANVSNAQVRFDSLKTPLGVLGNTEKQIKPTDEITLNEPMNSYRPVYEDNGNEDNSDSFAASSMAAVKKTLKNDKANWMMTFGLFLILVFGGMKLFKGNDNDIKVGLSQSLKDREINLYRGGLNMGLNTSANINSNPGVGVGVGAELQGNIQSPISGNYGLRAYQQGTRNPYVSSEIQRPRPSAAPISSVNLQQAVRNASIKPQTQNINQNLMQNTTQATQTAHVTQGTIQKPNVSARTKTSNIDSIKFLESMTKIYEKNGRADLAQGLKTNMKKAKANLA